MALKEVAVPALAAAGGAGAGVGGAYAAGSLGYGHDTSNVKDKNVVFDASLCDDKVIQESVLGTLFWQESTKMSNNSTPNPDNPSTLNAKMGCLKIQLLPDGYDGKNKVDAINITLSAWDESKTNAIIIKSKLSKSNQNNQASLVSRVVYLSKQRSQQPLIEKGWEFISKIDVDAKIVGLLGGDEETPLKKILKLDDTTDTIDILLAKGKGYKWNSSTKEDKSSIFSKIKIKKENKYALFFGRDLTGGEKIGEDLESVYTKKFGWAMCVTPCSPTSGQTFFVSNIQGTWT